MHRLEINCTFVLFWLCLLQRIVCQVYVISQIVLKFRISMPFVICFYHVFITIIHPRKIYWVNCNTTVNHTVGRSVFPDAMLCDRTDCKGSIILFPFHPQPSNIKGWLILLLKKRTLLPSTCVGQNSLWPWMQKRLPPND